MPRLASRLAPRLAPRASRRASRRASLNPLLASGVHQGASGAEAEADGGGDLLEVTPCREVHGQGFRLVY